MEANEDDDLYSPTGHHGLFPPSNMLYHQRTSPPPPASSTIWYWIMCIMDYVTRPSFGVVVAVIVIIVMHYKPNTTAIFANVMENGIQETALDCLLGLCDLARAYYQIACEYIRNFSSSENAREHSSAIMSSATTGRTSGGGIPPPLVVQPLFDSSELRNGSNVTRCDRPPSPSASSSSSTAQILSSMLNQDIEPAFLDEKDYPKGWLVYHPTLGVVPKDDADKFDRKNTSGTQ